MILHAMRCAASTLLSSLALFPALALLMAVTAPVAAADTPLVIPSDDKLVAVIEPGSGAVGLYFQEPAGSTRKGGGWVLSEIELLERYIYAERDGAPYSFLRIGATNNVPTGENLLGQIETSLGKALSSRAKDPAKPLAVRIREMENIYWSAAHPYDGKMVGAIAGSGNSHYLMLGIPSKRTLAVYELNNQTLKLAAFRALGPELYIASAFGASRPNPQEVINTALKGLRARITDPKQLKAAEELAQEQLDGMALGPGVGDPNQPAASLPPVDLWIGTGSGPGAAPGAFLVIDASGPRAMLFQFDGARLNLRGVRNLALDLAANTIAGEAIKATPGENATLDETLRDTQRIQLAQRYKLIDLGTETDREKLREVLRGQLAALISSRSTQSGVKSLDAAISGQVATLVFPQQRRIVSLDFTGGNQLDLASIRDYTVDLGSSILAQMINERIQAQTIYTASAKAAANGQPETAKRNLELVLSLDPFLGEKAVKDTSFRSLRSAAWWQPLLEEATKKAAELEAAFKDRTKPR